MTKKKKEEDVMIDRMITDFETGEVTEVPEDKLNKLIVKETLRPNGTVRVQLDFSNCPTLAEQHTAHLTDINYLIEKHKPDELQAYITARSQYRTEILGHDFSREPDFQEAKNIVYRSQQEFENLPDKVRMSFKNHVEFLKFIDNPRNAEKMLELGILTKKQVTNLQSLEAVPPSSTATPTKHEEKAATT